MSPLALAWRSLTRAPLRAALGITGIAAVGALLFDMLLLSNGLLVSFRELLDDTHFDVRVTATQALPTMGPRITGVRETVKSLRALPEIEMIAPFRFGRAQAIGLDGAESGLNLIGSEPGARRAWTLLRGEDISDARIEADPPPVVVNESLAQALGVSQGGLFRLRAATDHASAAPAVVVRLSGIAEFPFDASGDRTALVTLPVFEKALGGVDPDRADLLLVGSRRSAGSDGAVAAIRRARPDLHAFSNAQFIARFGSADFSYFRQISFVLSSITLFFAFLLVATLLTVSVNQRLGEVAALRALGFSRRRVALDLLAEAVLLAGTGGLLALPLGAGLARVLDSILRKVPDLPVRLHFFVLEPRAVLLQCALLGVVGVLAAAYPVYIATRLPIAATLRKEVVS